MSFTLKSSLSWGFLPDKRTFTIILRVAQLVERRTFKARVAGSSPASEALFHYIDFAYSVRGFFSGTRFQGQY